MAPGNNKIDGGLIHRLKIWDNRPWAVFFGICILMVTMAVAKYFSLHSTHYDLGIFLKTFANIAWGDWQRLFWGHVQPLRLLWSAFYKFLPSDIFPVFMLIMQATLLTFPVAGLYRRYGALSAVAYVLYFPLWYNALFDFHMDHLAVPLLFGFFFLEKSGRIWWAVVLALLLALVKEPFALQTAACGIYLLLIRKHVLAGSLLVITGFLYFYAATHYFLPYFGQGPRGGLDLPAFSWLGHTLSDMIWFIITKPYVVLSEIFSGSGKIQYLFYIFGALAFIPLLRPGILIIALPVIAISLLSRGDNYSGLFFHYTAGLIAPLTIAFAEGLPTARKIWSRLNFPKALFGPLLLVCLLIIHIKMAPSPISHVFWDKDSWAYSYQAYIPIHRDKMMKEAILLHVPSDPEVAISSQNTLNWGYLAHRKNYFPFPVGVKQTLRIPKSSERSLTGLWNFIKTGEIAPTTWEERSAEYVVLDLKRPWFIGDEGCPWINGQCNKNGEFSSRFLALVQQTKESFDTVFKEDGFYIFKRKAFPKKILK